MATTAAAITTAVTAAIHTERVRRAGASGICIVIEVASSLRKDLGDSRQNGIARILPSAYYADKKRAGGNGSWFR
ncbi:hypothetical protein [Streptomyces gottesmaniae]|uniref:hypothetical protein n=1 Tax=Streptomyces gottesmaniae TaxID=3075518 RepID=UPI00178C9FD8|nr:hypothetical protein [Streptomyces sp. DSM 3412]